MFARAAIFLAMTFGFLLLAINIRKYPEFLHPAYAILNPNPLAGVNSIALLLL